MKRLIKIILLGSLFSISSAALAAQQTAVFAGGCFWGVDAVFKQLKGVVSSTAGYSGGTANTATYHQVSSGKTGHAEAVKVVFEDSEISYRQLLEVFFTVAHDPTQYHKQGPDKGPQYRSAVFYTNHQQQQQLQQYISELNKQKAFKAPIVTEVVALKDFYDAEAYHQNYVALHPDEPYIRFHDQPKLQQLQQKYPKWIKSTKG